jgi:hypothetical protein
MTSLLENQSSSQDTKLEFELSSFGLPLGQITGHFKSFGASSEISLVRLNFNDVFSNSHEKLFPQTFASQELRDVQYGHAELGTYRSSTRRTRHASAQKVLQRLLATRQRRSQAQLETNWLARNRSQYAGQWIAIQGDRLIANSERAQDVFTAAKTVTPRALVVQIEKSELPFAGW